MSNNKTYKAIEVCNELNISINTLTNWYRWQNNLLKTGEITKKYLPEPSKLEHEKGKPRIWTQAMVDELKEYKSSIVFGRNGVYCKFSNPNHKNTKKYKKSLNSVDKK